MRLVVKIGGSLLVGGVPKAIVEDAAARAASDQLVLVHGGGGLVTDMAQKLGKEQRFITSPDGIRSRYTDRETAEIYTMVMSGLVSKRLVAALAEKGTRVVSLTGMDGALFQAARKKKLVAVDERGRRMLIDGGYTGRVRQVDSALLELLLVNGYLPLVSPVAISEECEPLNIDGDRAAASAAAALKADAIVFLTNVDGLMMDGKLVPTLSAAKAKALLPSIGPGMQKKVMASVECVEGGVAEAVICSGSTKGPIGAALRHDNCTVIS